MFTVALLSFCTCKAAQNSKCCKKRDWHVPLNKICLLLFLTRNKRRVCDYYDASHTFIQNLSLHVEYVTAFGNICHLTYAVPANISI